MTVAQFLTQPKSYGLLAPRNLPVTWRGKEEGVNGVKKVEGMEGGREREKWIREGRTILGRQQ